jgi:hypothetical protein
MRCIVPAEAVADTRLTGADVRALCAIGRYTNARGEGAFASAVRLAKCAGITRSTFFEAVDRLIGYGYVRRRSRKGRSSVYDILFKDVSAMDQLALGLEDQQASRKQTRPANPDANPSGSGARPVRLPRTRTLLGTYSLNGTPPSLRETTTASGGEVVAHQGPVGTIYRQAADTPPVEVASAEDVALASEMWRAALGGRTPAIPA